MVVLWTPSRDTWSTMYSLPWRYSCSKTAAPCTAEQDDKTQGAKQKITRNNKRLQHSNQPTCPQTLSRTISRSLATILPTTQASLNIPPNLRATLPLWAHQQVEVSLRLSHQNLLFVEREHFQVAIRAKVPPPFKLGISLEMCFKNVFPSKSSLEITLAPPKWASSRLWQSLTPSEPADSTGFTMMGKVSVLVKWFTSSQDLPWKQRGGTRTHRNTKVCVCVWVSCSEFCTCLVQKRDV